MIFPPLAGSAQGMKGVSLFKSLRIHPERINFLFFLTDFPAFGGICQKHERRKPFKILTD
jgi:hypothetical protein